MSITRKLAARGLGVDRLIGSPDIQHLQTINAGNANGGNVTAAAPTTTVQQGDLYMIFAVTRAAVTPGATASGMTIESTGVANDALGWQVFYAYSPDATPRAITTTGFINGSAVSVQVYLFRGVDQTSPFDVAPVVVGTAASNPIDVPAITPTYKNSRGLYTLWSADDNSWAVTAGAEGWTAIQSTNYSTAMSVVTSLSGGLAAGMTTGAVRHTAGINGPDALYGARMALRAAA